jgi:anti-sigma factor RsiW
MIECPNGEIRDRLPDLVHGQLDPVTRVAVTAHVAACVACAAELTLLRELRASLRAAPPVDVTRIVAALPRSRRPATGFGRVAQRAWDRFDWRIAAAVVALAVGGGSAVIWNATSRGDGSASVPVRPQPVAAARLTIDADLADASTVELESLLRELESFDGLPAGEPEPLLPSPGPVENQQ